MTDFIERLNDGRAKRWYERYGNPEILNHLSDRFDGKGYTLDINSGLFYKESGSINTGVNLVFVRPTDIHYHGDVKEDIKVISGYGFKISECAGNFTLQYIEGGDRSLIEKGGIHGFCPARDGFLEVNVVCDRLLDPSKEKCLERFDIFNVWKQLQAGIFPENVGDIKLNYR